jgi:regulatory protein
MEDELLQAKKKAMSLLEHMDRTEWQLRDKLTGKGFSEEAVDGAVEYVKSFHYLDDLRYAIRFVEIHHEQRSLQRLKQDLYQRHVSEENIEIALDHIDRDDTAALQRAVEKLTKGEGELSFQDKQKIAGKLYRKGFSLSDIKKELDMYT